MSSREELFRYTCVEARQYEPYAYTYNFRCLHLCFRKKSTDVGNYSSSSHGHVIITSREPNYHMEISLFPERFPNTAEKGTVRVSLGKQHISWERATVNQVWSIPEPQLPVPVASLPPDVDVTHRSSWADSGQTAVEELYRLGCWPWPNWKPWKEGADVWERGHTYCFMKLSLLIVRESFVLIAPLINTFSHIEMKLRR